MPIGLRRFFPHGVAACWLHQTANQGLHRPTFRLGWPAASRSACASENHAFPTSAIQNVALALPTTDALRYGLDARAAVGKVRRVRGHLGKAELGRGPIKATRSGTRVQGCACGIDVPTVTASGRTRPWRAPVRRCGSPAQSARSLYGGIFVGLLVVDDTIDS